MADEKPKTVTVEALEWHTYNGKEYDVGDTYDIDEQLADSVAQQGKAIRVDRVARAKEQKADTEKAAKRSTKVEPMTTQTKDIPVSRLRKGKPQRIVKPSKARR